MTSYPTPEYRRTALAPGVLGAIVLVAGIALIDSEQSLWIRFAVSILALIVSVYAVQAGRRWWLLGLVPIALAWNPVVVIDFGGPLWVVAHLVAAVVMVAAGILIRIRNPEDRNGSRR
jgi:uncharacterized membrane protein